MLTFCNDSHESAIPLPQEADVRCLFEFKTVAPEGEKSLLELLYNKRKSTYFSKLKKVTLQ